jgi:LmbE family N-acetylglucosaminyl deacetylase
MRNHLLGALLLLVLSTPGRSDAQLPAAPPYPEADGRYKADILLVVGHPDDDALIAGYLARAVFDQHKSVAVIVCTSGDGGGNEVADEAGAALGQIRIQEAKQALGSLGVNNVWFLGNHDTPGQNPLASLDRWGHGHALEEVVRLVRITRPEVILTLLPDQVAGENHGDHQAAGIVATEAFDVAGDPTAFPEQVADPRDLHGMMNMTEGLRPWQAKKLYYFTDAFEGFSQYWHNPRVASPYRTSFLKGTGPEYSSTEVSPSRQVSYAQIAAEEQSFYLTQEGNLGEEALAKEDFREFEQPVHFIFGKSVVNATITGDIFEGVQPGFVSFMPVEGYQPPKQEGITLQIGDPWNFYREFWRAHHFERLAQLIPVPERAVEGGGTLYVPLLLQNGTSDSAEVTLTVLLPKAWTERSGSARYPIRPGQTYPALSVLVAPASGEVGWQEITWKAEANGRPIGNVTMRVLVGMGGGLPQ